MKQHIRYFIFGFLVCALISTTTAVYAADSTRIDVYFRKLKYIFNGVEKAPPSTAQGFIYQGTTYVPLRFISESLDKEVSWDGETGAIQVSNRPKEFTMDDWAIRDTSTGSIIRLGMTREEVEKQLGEHTDEIDFRKIFIYNGLEIFYRDNKVAGLMINASNNLTNRFQTNRAIGLGSSLKDVMSRYGNGWLESQYHSITYKFMNENGKLRKMVDGDRIEDFTTVYVISVLYFDNPNKTASMILLGDFNFALTSQ